MDPQAGAVYSGFWAKIKSFIFEPQVESIATRY
jgi:hypothetical protein